jgi:hypothetical protein
MVTGTELTSDEREESKGRGTNRRAPVRLWVAVGIAGIVISGAWLKYSSGASGSSAEPEALDEAIVDRCVKVRLGPLSARELPEMVKRACAARGIAYNAEIIKALNRSEIFRPRAIIQAVDAIAAGKSISEAVSGQAA